jgi:hypothetical protein
MGLRVPIPLGYHIGQLATGLRRAAVVHVCLRDFPRDTMVFLGVACRAARSRQKVVCIRQNGGGAFSAGGISGFNERLSDTRRSWSLSDNPVRSHPISR